MSPRNALRLALLLAPLLASPALHAQLFRAYLSSSGQDANPCTLAAPCRLLPAALNAVASGGEIWMLDSANYNATTVVPTKSVTIVAVPGALGSLVMSGPGSALEVNSVGVRVTVRNVNFVALPGASGQNGIFVGAGKLSLEHCVLANLPANAISVSGNSFLRIANSIIRDNGGAGLSFAAPASADVSATLFRDNAAYAILAAGNAATTTPASVTVSDSILTSNVAGTAINVVANALSTSVRVFLSRSTVSGFATAFSVSANFFPASALVSLSGNTIASNATLSVITGTGAQVISAGNNHVIDNGASVGNSISSFALQ